MTREEAKELLPIIEHFANGGDIQHEDNGIWYDISCPSWLYGVTYRIKRDKTNDVLISELYETLGKIFKP